MIRFIRYLCRVAPEEGKNKKLYRASDLWEKGHNVKQDVMYRTRILLDLHWAFRYCDRPLEARIVSRYFPVAGLQVATEAHLHLGVGLQIAGGLAADQVVEAVQTLAKVALPRVRLTSIDGPMDFRKSEARNRFWAAEWWSLQTRA